MTKLPRSGSGVVKPRPLHAREGDRQHEIMYLLYNALWKKGEQAWTKISRIVKEHVPDPLATPEECDLDPREEAQVTIIDLTSLLSWTTYRSIPRRIQRTRQISGIKFRPCPPCRITRHRIVRISILPPIV